MASGAMCRGFNSLQAHQNFCEAKIKSIFNLCGPLAQLVEQLTLNQRVAGSIPARLTMRA